MASRQLRFRATSLAGVFLFVVLLANAVLAGPRPVATVTAVTGTLSVKRLGTNAFNAVARKSNVYAGDMVRTGANGKTTLLFTDGSVVRLSVNSAIVVRDPSGAGDQGLFSALVGVVWAKLRPRQSVITPHANLVVRGTEINLNVEENGTTTLTVLVGVVDFFNQYGRVAVEQSQQSTVHAGGAPSKPVTIANPALTIEWTVDLERALIAREKFFVSLKRDLTRLQSLRAQTVQQPNDASALRSLGDAYYDAGNFAPALAAYEEANRLAPGESATLTRIGYALLEMDRVDEAEASYKSALAAAPGGSAMALTGLAWVSLQHDRPAQAQGFAEQAVAGAPADAEAHIVLGLALMRQPEKLNDAIKAFEAVSQAQPGDYQYQAHAWLAMIYLEQSNPESALREAKLAVQQAPQSALAHSNLALVEFFTGQSDEAVREARLAAQLNPDSVAAQVALGQAQLAQGEIDAAARSAARAVALDPKLPQAHYLLGVADAQRRDYTHATRELGDSLRLAPEFLPAVSALARVYVRMGDSKRADDLLHDYLVRHPESSEVRLAVGEAYYESARYREATESFRKAIELNPQSAFGYARLARVLLDENQLNEAIRAGQKAVEIAPGVGQYHSDLGLAYNYSRLDTQAEREFRTALALDPQNALALVQLGLHNQEGDPRTTQRTSAVNYVQGFIHDPEIARDLLRGRVKTEVEPALGSDNHELSLVHRDIAADGKLNFYGRFFNGRDDGDRDNSDEKLTTIRQDTTYALSNHSDIYLHLLHRRDDRGLPGTELNPALDDRDNFRFNEGVLALRHRFSGHSRLWAGFFASRQRDTRTNPDEDPSLSLLINPAGLFTGARASTLSDTSRSAVPELRFDWDLKQTPQRSGTLTFGLARPRTITERTAALTLPGFPDEPPTTGNLMLRQSAPAFLAYTQLEQRLNNRASFAAQLRYLRLNRTVDQEGSFGGFPLDASESNSKSYLLPSVVANYQATQKTALRLSASRRVTDITSSVFAPTGTLLTTEGYALPLGLPDSSRNGHLDAMEFDIEHHLSPGQLVKLYFFHSAGRNLNYDFSRFANPSNFVDPNDPEPDLIIDSNVFSFDRISRSGVGVRYEQPLGRSLFGQVNLSFNRTTSDSTIFDPITIAQIPLPFNGQTAPYHPRVAGSVTLNYVSHSGNKIGVAVNYLGSFFQDVVRRPADTTIVSRLRSPSATTVDLLLAREPSVHNQIFLQVTNLFDSQQIVFNGIPYGNRRVRLGATRRF